MADEPFRVHQATPALELEAPFRNQIGWIGADGNYSIAISPEKRIWFFSDTWIGEVVGDDSETSRREKARLVNNSVGVQTGRGENSPVEFHWGKTTKGESAAFFAPQDAQGWFWPFAGVYDGSAIQLFLWQMEKREGPAAFAFKNKAVWLATIANPLDAPENWRVNQHPFPFGEMREEQRVLFGSAICSTPDWTYIYGVRELKRDNQLVRNLLVARVQLIDFADFSNWRFWNGMDWSDDFHQAQPQCEGIATEFSVTFVPGLQRYVVVYHDAFLSPQIVARASATPYGPWSEKVMLYTSPEAKWGREIFCYSGKAHASLSGADELVITYAANSQRWPEVLRDARLYWPRFVRVHLSR